MAPIFAIIRYALLETFFCIPILPKTFSPSGTVVSLDNHFHFEALNSFYFC